MLDGNLSALHAGCTGIHRRLEATESRTAMFVARAEELRQQRLQVEARASASSKLLARYQLTDAELEALYTLPLEADKGARFFAALGRLDDIRKDCKALLSSALQSVGIEILEDMANHQVRWWVKLVCECFNLKNTWGGF